MPGEEKAYIHIQDQRAYLRRTNGETVMEHPLKCEYDYDSLRVIISRLALENRISAREMLELQRSLKRQTQNGKRFPQRFSSS